MAHDSKYDKPRNTSNPRKAASADNKFSGWHGWVNVNLTDAAKKKWFEWAQNPTQFYDAFGNLCANGYKVTVKFEPNTGAFSAFITQQDQQHDDFGWGLSERAADPYTALHRAVYIHAVILNGDWSPYKVSAGQWTDTW